MFASISGHKVLGTFTDDLSHGVSKSVFTYAKIMAQISCEFNRASDQRLYLRYIDRTLSLLPKSNRKAMNRNWSNLKPKLETRGPMVL